MMTFGIGKKIALGFGGLLGILLVICVLSVTRMNAYSGTLERISRENYDSVTYAQSMRDALRTLEDAARDNVLINASSQLNPTDAFNRFDVNLERGARNVTLAGEQQLVDQLTHEWKSYRSAYDRFNSAATPNDRLRIVSDELRPRADRVDALAAKLIDINLQNIVSVDGQIRQASTQAKRALYALVGIAVALAILFTLIISRSILQPLRSLTRSAHEIEQGNLDLVVRVRGRDEVAQLAEAFNKMAAKLREFRRSDRAKILRTQQTTQLAVDSLPDAVALVSMDGRVELANQVARKLFGLSPDATLDSARVPRLREIYQEARDNGQPVGPGGYDTVIQVFDDGGGERFFLPRAIPIVDAGESIGVTVVLADVTNLRKIDEMKSGLLSVVSHELKTPLTSIRMATHLLLDERIGTLSPKQLELLFAAREDADRLNSIVENLLDMARMESGRAQLQLAPQSIDLLLQDMTAPHQAAYRDKGVTLNVDAGAADGTKVLVDADRIEHVFTNLLSNSLRFTPAGGTVTVSAAPDAEAHRVRITVEDTGTGVAPEHLPRIFDRFYRAPGQKSSTGAGLGLAIAKDIVEAHGGTISAKSEVGNGLRVTFTLTTENEMRDRKEGAQ